MPKIKAGIDKQQFEQIVFNFLPSGNKIILQNLLNYLQTIPGLDKLQRKTIYAKVLFLCDIGKLQTYRIPHTKKKARYINPVAVYIKRLN